VTRAACHDNFGGEEATNRLLAKMPWRDTFWCISKPSAAAVCDPWWRGKKHGHERCHGKYHERHLHRVSVRSWLLADGRTVIDVPPAIGQGVDRINAKRVANSFGQFERCNRVSPPGRP